MTRFSLFGHLRRGCFGRIRIASILLLALAILSNPAICAQPAFDEQGLLISGDFSGGNIKVLSINEDIVTISPDLSDTSANWFYWNFKARSDVARTVTFKLQSKSWAIIGPNGPAVSTDDGKTWDYLSAYANQLEDDAPYANTRSFTYDFKPGETVQFSCTIPYVLQDLETFIDTIKDKPQVRISTLTQSEEGRDVPLIVIGNPEAKKDVLFTGRHHCCEAMASFALEGLANYLANDAPADLLNEYCFYIIPFVDIDGVENGDQGKERRPHDHNRDYVRGIYAPVRAIRELANTLNPVVFFDFHCPAINDVKTHFYLNEPILAEFARFDSALKETTADSEIVYDGSKNLQLGAFQSPRSNGFFSAFPNIRLSCTLELPYSGGAVPYQPQNVRAFGTDFARALEVYLRGD